jgi:hypothetical protein
MTLVGEDNKIGKIVNLDPGDRLLALPIAAEFLHFRLIQGCNLMAAYAKLDRRDSGYRRSAGIGVAILAGDFVITCVAFMAEGDGLYGSGWLTGKGQPDSNS